MEISEFYAARLDEDEAAARAALPGPWMTGRVRDHLADNVVYGQSRDWPGHIVQVCNVDYGHNKVADSDHIARHDPARVLREVDAGRRILAEHRTRIMTVPGLRGDVRQHWCETCDVPGDYPGSNWCTTIRAAVAVYSDHPDYEPAWSPEP